MRDYSNQAVLSYLIQDSLFTCVFLEGTSLRPSWISLKRGWKSCFLGVFFLCVFIRFPWKFAEEGRHGLGGKENLNFVSESHIYCFFFVIDVNLG